MGCGGEVPGRRPPRGQTEPGPRGADSMDSAGAWIFLLSLGAVGGQNISARIGEPLLLNCKGAPRKPPQQLEWKLGGPLDSVARVLPNGSLLLPSVGIEDEGIFRCRAVNRAGRETKSNYRVRVYQIPRKPEILDPASELTAGISSKVGTCVVDGGYPAGAVCWHLNGKVLTPDGKGTSVREETRRDPETGLYRVESTLTVVPARGGPPRLAFSCSYVPLPGHGRALHSGSPIRPSVWEPLQEVRLTMRPEGGSVGAGEDVTLTCEAPARPPPRLHWLKDVSEGGGRGGAEFGGGPDPADPRPGAGGAGGPGGHGPGGGDRLVEEAAPPAGRGEVRAGTRGGDRLSPRDRGPGSRSLTRPLPFLQEAPREPGGGGEGRAQPTGVRGGRE
uniref:Advanced glycosylation end-product specific receptor n=1 Tax=Ornithorhynchus anatinus TaxID=9258 RepID=A0A6I8NJJ5_ORNAN